MAISFVEGQVVDNGTDVATTPAFTNAFAAGQLVVLTACFDGGSDTTTSVIDSKGNTYLKIAGASVGNGSNLYLATYYSVLTYGGASPTVTLNFNSAATNVNVVVQYFNGFVGSPTLDKFTAQLNASSTTCTSGATSTTSNPVSLVVGGGVHISTPSAFSLGAGFSNLTESSVDSRQCAMESLVTSSTGAQTANFTIAAARVNAAAVTTFFDYVPTPSVSTTAWLKA